jgi:hypothetical protein
MNLKTLLLVPLLLFVSGCPLSPLERKAYDTVVGAKAFLDSEKKSHPECAYPATGPSANVTVTWCANINKGIASKDLLIDAITVYCAGPVFDAPDKMGACQPPAKGTPAYTQAQAKLQSAMNNYNQVAADLKAAK